MWIVTVLHVRRHHAASDGADPASSTRRAMPSSCFRSITKCTSLIAGLDNHTGRP